MSENHPDQNSTTATEGYSRKEINVAAARIASSLRRFIEEADPHISGLEIEYLMHTAQFLENLSER
jgi:hypothetical protein